MSGQFCRPTKTWRDFDGMSPSDVLRLTNSMYGPGGATLALGGRRTQTRLPERPTIGSSTLRWSPSTMWVTDGLRTSTTLSALDASWLSSISSYPP